MHRTLLDSQVLTTVFSPVNFHITKQKFCIVPVSLCNCHQTKSLGKMHCRAIYFAVLSKSCCLKCLNYGANGDDGNCRGKTISKNHAYSLIIYLKYLTLTSQQYVASPSVVRAPSLFYCLPHSAGAVAVTSDR